MHRVIRNIRYCLVIAFISCGPVFAYNIDSLMTSIGQVPFDQQHKKIKEELGRLKESSLQDAVELGDYWINVLNEKQRPIEAVDIIMLTSDSYYRLGNYANSIKYAQTAKKLFQQLGDKNGEAVAIRQIGFTYGKMNQFEDAYNNFTQSASVFESTSNYQELAATYNHMGNLIEKWKQDYKLAESLYRKSISNAEKVNDQESISYSLEFLGIIKSMIGDKDSSVYYLNQSLEIRKTLNKPFPLALSYTNLAEVMDQNGDIQKAHQFYNKALQISNAIKYHDLSNFIYGNLSKIHRKKGNLDSAITYMEMKYSLQDSLFDLQKTKEFAEIKEKYESEIKEERITSLNNKIELDHQKNQKRIYLFTAIISILGLLILSGVIVGIMVYNRNQKKIAKEKIEQEKLRYKMIIEAEEKERTRIAKDLHDSLGQMLAALKMNLNSLSINNSTDGQLVKTTQILDDTITEMRSISHAMMPESLVKNGLAKALMDISNHVEKNQTQVNVNVENWRGWNSTGEYVLYRIVQELLNNTLKHAQAKNVNIELNQFEDEINLIYEDDGIGFDMNSIKSDGIGLQNMNNRISSINGHIEFDSKPGVGTTAIISVPLNV